MPCIGGHVEEINTLGPTNYRQIGVDEIVFWTQKVEDHLLQSHSDCERWHALCLISHTLLNCNLSVLKVTGMRRPPRGREVHLRYSLA
jgi:hypothetical protein